MTSNQSELANYEFRLEAPEPSRRNSAGRMLTLLQHLRPDRDYYYYAASMFNEGLESTNENQSRLYLRFMTMLQKLYYQLLFDIKACSRIDQALEDLLLGRLNSLQLIVFPDNPRANCRNLDAVEFSYLEMASTLLTEEEQVGQGDLDEIVRLVDDLMKELVFAPIDEYVKECIMELARQARHAAEYYRIRGARGFKEAFRRMLGEIDFVLLSQKGNSTEKQDWVRNQGWYTPTITLLGKLNELANHVEKLGPVLEGWSRHLLGGS